MANVTKVGTEFRIDQDSASDYWPQIIALGGGGFVVAWATRSGVDSLHAQGFSASGQRVGSEIVLGANPSGTSPMMRFDVAALANNGYALAWEDYSQRDIATAPYGTHRSDVALQLVGSNGALSGATRLVGPVFEGSPTAYGSQQSPHLAVEDDGTFVLSWFNGEALSRDQNGALTGKFDTSSYISTFDSNGNIGGSTIFGFGPYDRIVDMADLPGNAGYLALRMPDNSTSANSVVAQRFDTNGAPVGATIPLAIAHSQSKLLTFRDTSGNIRFVVASNSTSENVVRAQVFALDGTAIGSQLVVSGANLASSITLADLGGGRFALGWTAIGAGFDGGDVKVQVFDEGGSAVSSAFSVSTATLDGQSFPAITALSGNRFVVAYSSNGGAGAAGAGIRAQIFELDVPPPPVFTSGADIVDFNAPSEQQKVAIASGADVYHGGDGGDIVTLPDTANLTASKFSATATFLGEGGNDVITGGNGVSKVDGGAGDDRIDGGDGNDLLSGNDGSDILRGGNGDDVLFGAAAGKAFGAYDQLFGEAGNDTLTADANGWFHAVGGDGNDTIIGGLQGDLIFGGSGNDVLLAAPTATSLDMAVNNIHGGDDNDRIVGGLQADVLIGGRGVDSIEGLAGGDLIVTFDPEGKFDSEAATKEAEIVKGGSGDDTILARGNVSVTGWEQDDTLLLQKSPERAGFIVYKTGALWTIDQIEIVTTTPQPGSTPQVTMRVVSRLTVDSDMRPFINDGTTESLPAALAGYIGKMKGGPEAGPVTLADAAFVKVGFTAASSDTVDFSMSQEAQLASLAMKARWEAFGGQLLTDIGDAFIEDASGTAIEATITRIADKYGRQIGGAVISAISTLSPSAGLNTALLGSLARNVVPVFKIVNAIEFGMKITEIVTKTIRGQYQGRDGLFILDLNSAVAALLGRDMVSLGLTVTSKIGEAIYKEVLSNIEVRFEDIGNHARSGIGTSGADVIDNGKSVAAALYFTGDGNDAVKDGGGNSTIIGGSGNGNDTYDGGSGIDTVEYTSASTGIEVNLSAGTASGAEIGQDVLLGIENVVGGQGADTITGSSAANILSGGDGADVLGGGAGNDRLLGEAGDDTLDGGTGTDTLVGGGGDDSYVVDNVKDSVIELADEGADTVRSSVSHTLASNVEDLVLLGTGALKGTGNTLANKITGNAGRNVLDGGAGDDTLIGGKGDDTYIVGASGDYIVEAADEGAADTVLSSVTHTLATNVEKLTLTGIASIDGFGNSGDNVITGNAADNGLDGGAGNDRLIGGAGNDFLNGGAGADRLEGGTGFDVVLYDGAAARVVVDLTKLALNEGDAAGDSYATIERIAGTQWGDVMRGNGSANEFDGRSGDDQLFGLGGNDVLTGGAGGDLLDGGVGTDEANYSFSSSGVRADLADAAANTGDAAGDSYVAIENLRGTQSADHILGNDLANTLFGLGGDDVLVGRLGSDALWGGSGNDAFVFLSPGDGGPAGDVIRDFTTGDSLQVLGSNFGGLVAGALDAALFETVSSGATKGATKAATRFYFDMSGAKLYFDQDGKGGGDGQLLASFSTTGVQLSAGDVKII